MTSEFDMSSIRIPYGILHDSNLSNIKCENNLITFSFDIEVYPEDYTDDFYKQYEGFKHCDMTVELCEDPINYFIFGTCVNNRGKLRGLSLNKEEFLTIINSVDKATFVECSVSDNEFKIELSVDFHNAKGKNKKYRKYCMCYITLNAAKVKWKWY